MQFLQIGWPGAEKYSEVSTDHCDGSAMSPVTNKGCPNDSMENTSPSSLSRKSSPSPQLPAAGQHPQGCTRRAVTTLTELVPSRLLSRPASASPATRHSAAMHESAPRSGRRHAFDDVNSSGYSSPAGVVYAGEGGCCYHCEPTVAGDRCSQPFSDSNGSYNSSSSSLCPPSRTACREHHPSAAAIANGNVINSLESSAWDSPTTAATAGGAVRDEWAPQTWGHAPQDQDPELYSASALLRGDPFCQSQEVIPEGVADHQREHLALHDNRVSFHGYVDGPKGLGVDHRNHLLEHLRANQENIQDQESFGSLDEDSCLDRPAGAGKKRRRRVQTPTQRKAANMRERRRMCHLNVAFDSLKEHLPNIRNRRKLSRIQTLRAAIYYIHLLSECLQSP